jgi:hypothetical protein
MQIELATEKECRVELSRLRLRVSELEGLLERVGHEGEILCNGYMVPNLSDDLIKAIRSALERKEG